MLEILYLLFGSLTSQLAGTLLVLLVIWYHSRPSNIPPGPRGIPIFGYLFHNNGKKPHQTFKEISKKYGPVSSVYLGSRLCVILGDYNSVRKALMEQGDVFSGRPTGFADKILKENRKTLVFGDGIHWREHRRFALSTLREYGIGKSQLEPAIMDEIHCFVEEVAKKNGDPFNITNLLAVSVCNNICVLEFGKRFQYDDPTFLRLKKLLDDFARTVGEFKLDTFLPWINKIPGVKSWMGWHIVIHRISTLNEYMKSTLPDHYNRYAPGSTADFIDAYLTESDKRKEENNPHADLFDEPSLIADLRHLFIAGTETTANTLRWGLQYMILHPDIQRKVQQEIDDVIGRERLPSLDEKPNMPYTEATLLEIQRKSTIVPLSVPHSTREDVNFCGYHIPKDTPVFPNLWAVHHDERLFPDPETFRPERFIDEFGKVHKPDCLIPFSIGKRFCLGEPLARMELFLYFTALLQRFTFTSPDKQLSTEPLGSGILSAQPFLLQAIPRY